MSSSLWCSKIRAQKQLTAQSDVEFQSMTTSPKCGAREPVWSSLLWRKVLFIHCPRISLKNGGLCWNPAVSHVVYQPSPTAGHPDTVFRWLICFCNHAAVSSNIIHNIAVLFTLSWADTGGCCIHNAPEITWDSPQWGLQHGTLTMDSRCWIFDQSSPLDTSTPLVLFSARLSICLVKQWGTCRTGQRHPVEVKRNRPNCPHSVQGSRALLKQHWSALLMVDIGKSDWFDRPCFSAVHIKLRPGGHAVTFLCFYIFPELHWDPLSVHYCVCFLLPGPTYSEKRGYATARPLEWTAIYWGWMEELRMARDPLSAVIGMRSAAAIPLGPLLVLIKIRCIFTPRSVGSFLLRVALKLLLSPTEAAQSRGPRPAHAWHMEDQNTAIYTLHIRPTLSDTFSVQIACSKVLGDQSWVNTLLARLQGGPEICCAQPAQWSNNQRWTRSQ